MIIGKKSGAPRNRTLVLSAEEKERLRQQLLLIPPASPFPEIPTGTICGDYRTWIPQLPHSSVDLLILDPPYNLDKTFESVRFNKRAVPDYTEWLDKIVQSLMPLLKPTATVYICGDWFSSYSIFTVASRHFQIQNRITWEREKGRGAASNWKNTSEDIWFCTCSPGYTFNVETVKLRRRVLAPYRNGDGSPRDWTNDTSGNYRDTYPSNIWTDITIPFWSMPENTIHPTQKSEKLLAKLILASSNPNDMVLDPFLGSGTTSVVAKKLGRRFLGIELNEEYCLLAERRLEMADQDRRIQGFTEGVFWERNTLRIHPNPHE